MHFALNSLLQLVLLLLWREVAVASSQNCDLGCNSSFRETKIRTGLRHVFPCHLPSGVTKDTLDFYLNKTTSPLDINGDSNLVVDSTHLEIKSVGPAYEGRYYCRFNDLDPEPVQCVYVLGYPEFPSCGGSGSCVVDKEVVEGQSFTLEYDIRYVGGGCQNYNVSLRLDAMVLNESDYNYNSSSKTRYVRKTLPYVTRSHEGFYNLTMTPMYRLDRDPDLVLSVRLTVKEATEPPETTSQLLSSNSSSSTPDTATTLSTPTLSTPTLSTPTSTMPTLSTPTLSTPTLSTPNRTTVEIEPNKFAAIVAGTIVTVAVVLVGGLVLAILLVIFLCKRLSGKSLDHKDEEAVPPPMGGAPDHLPSPPDRKYSDSTTATSVSAPVLDGSVQTLEVEEIVNPQCQLEVGNGTAQTDSTSGRLPISSSSSSGCQLSSGALGSCDDNFMSEEETTLNESSDEVFQSSSSRYCVFSNLGEGQQQCGANGGRETLCSQCHGVNREMHFSEQYSEGRYLNQLETCREEEHGDFTFFFDGDLTAMDHQRASNTGHQCGDRSRRDFVKGSSCCPSRRHGCGSIATPSSQWAGPGGHHQCSYADRMFVANGAHHHGNNEDASPHAGLKVVKADNKHQQHCPLCLVRSQKGIGHCALTRTNSTISYPAEHNFDFKNNSPNSTPVII